MTITLFHGNAGWLVAVLALLGAAGILAAIQDWLSDRLKVTFRPLRIRRRWDHPGAHVDLGAGRTGYVFAVYDDDAVKGRMYIIHSDDEDADPEWVHASHVLPLPAKAEPVPAGDS